MRPTHLAAHISRPVTLVSDSKYFDFVQLIVHFTSTNIYLAQY